MLSPPGAFGDGGVSDEGDGDLLFLSEEEAQGFHGSACQFHMGVFQDFPIHGDEGGI